MSESESNWILLLLIRSIMYHLYVESPNDNVPTPSLTGQKETPANGVATYPRIVASPLNSKIPGTVSLTVNTNFAASAPLTGSWSRVLPEASIVFNPSVEFNSTLAPLAAVLINAPVIVPAVIVPKSALIALSFEKCPIAALIVLPLIPGVSTLANSPVTVDVKILPRKYFPGPVASLYAVVNVTTPVPASSFIATYA
jgi:hypothetical protein